MHLPARLGRYVFLNYAADICLTQTLNFITEFIVLLSEVCVRACASFRQEIMEAQTTTTFHEIVLFVLW
jgi:hypothetical protein